MPATTPALSGTPTRRRLPGSSRLGPAAGIAPLPICGNFAGATATETSLTAIPRITACIFGNRSFGKNSIAKKLIAVWFAKVPNSPDDHEFGTPSDKRYSATASMAGTTNWTASGKIWSRTGRRTRTPARGDQECGDRNQTKVFSHPFRVTTVKRGPPFSKAPSSSRCSPPLPGPGNPRPSRPPARPSPLASTAASTMRSGAGPRSRTASSSASR